MPPLLISPPTLDAVPARKPDAPVSEERTTLLADNRRARFDYEIQRRLEAGIALLGTEIKSLRAGHANLRDGYARVEKGEVWLRNVHIAPWANAAHDNHDPLRPASSSCTASRSASSPARSRRRATRWCRYGCTYGRAARRSSSV